LQGRKGTVSGPLPIQKNLELQDLNLSCCSKSSEVGNQNVLLLMRISTSLNEIDVDVMGSILSAEHLI
jgi:hypothetical protein